MAKENSSTLPGAEGKQALSLGWVRGVQTHLVSIPPAGAALLGCLGLFVTIFECPMQQ